MKQKIKVWDLPTRLFHWTLAAAIAFMWYSGETGGNLLAWHLRCGLLILGLLVFRLCWGLWGSDTARFAQFVRGPKQILRYLKGGISESEQPGHNPLGALMVVALLAAAGIQVTTGLFSPDQNTFTNHGYLNSLISESAGMAMRKIHFAFFNLLLILAALHITAAFAYKFLKKNDLITPMFTGSKDWEGSLPKLKFAGAGKFLAALAVAAAVVWLMANIG